MDHGPSTMDFPTHLSHLTIHQESSAFVSLPYENEHFRRGVFFYFIDYQLIIKWHPYWHSLIKLQQDDDRR